MSEPPTVEPVPEPGIAEPRIPERGTSARTAPERRAPQRWTLERAAPERGAAVVEFVLVSVVAVVLALALAQLALFLWERNALMGSLSEGVRVAATEGRTAADGQRVAVELLRRSAGGRVARAVPIQGEDSGGMVVLRAEGTLPSFVPGVPGLPVRMTARMHQEEAL